MGAASEYQGSYRVYPFEATRYFLLGQTFVEPTSFKTVVEADPRAVHANLDLDDVMNKPHASDNSRNARHEVGQRNPSVVVNHGSNVRAQERGNPSELQHLGLAVIGTPGSGKSTFIQHALDLKTFPVSQTSTKRVSLEGVISVLRIHEFNLHEVAVTTEGEPCWPSRKGDGITSQIDGVVVVYSVTDLSSANPVPAKLRELAIPARF